MTYVLRNTYPFYRRYAAELHELSNKCDGNKMFKQLCKLWLQQNFSLEQETRATVRAPTSLRQLENWRWPIVSKPTHFLWLRHKDNVQSCLLVEIEAALCVCVCVCVWKRERERDNHLHQTNHFYWCFVSVMKDHNGNSASKGPVLCSQVWKCRFTSEMCHNGKVGIQTKTQPSTASWNSCLGIQPGTCDSCV